MVNTGTVKRAKVHCVFYATGRITDNISAFVVRLRKAVHARDQLASILLDQLTFNANAVFAFHHRYELENNKIRQTNQSIVNKYTAVKRNARYTHQLMGLILTVHENSKSIGVDLKIYEGVINPVESGDYFIGCSITANMLQMRPLNGSS